MSLSNALGRGSGSSGRGASMFLQRSSTTGSMDSMLTEGVGTGNGVADALVKEVHNYLYTLMDKTNVSRLEEFLNMIWAKARLELLKFLTAPASDALRFFDADAIASLDVSSRIVHPAPRETPLGRY